MLKGLKDSVKDLSENVKSAVGEKELDEDTLEPLLEDFRLKLLKNNVSLDVAEDIEKGLKDNLIDTKVKRGKVEEKVEEAFREKLEELLDDTFNFEEALEEASEPPVVFMIGFNGSGKTTTAAKLADYLQEDLGEEVVLGAGDTFRAASIEQLEEHGNNLGVKVVSHEYESDPAAVAYDAVEHADKHGKVAIVDTAGRSHSDRNLMDELQKMIDVNEPDITFLVVDALAGNDILEQAEAYEGMFDAIIATKMDIDEKGGGIVSISQRSGKPVAFLGTGQDYNELEDFNKEEFIDRIMD
ncbi:zeta toxin family protein [Candidatus Nanosalina sp. VS9-1]|uniref:zeta toxin family protein n=1 Tax=Candidatus Nanosalina sp. VS9-1 TaxID=3388566 RepID=UPI0039E1CF66